MSLDDPKTLALIELDKNIQGVKYRLAWEQPNGTYDVFWRGSYHSLAWALQKVFLQEVDPFIVVKKMFSDVESQLVSIVC